jgi:hypothetical protein
LIYPGIEETAMEIFLRRASLVRVERWHPDKRMEAAAQVFHSDRWHFLLACGAAIPLEDGNWLIDDPGVGVGIFPLSNELFCTYYQPLRGGVLERQAGT